MRCILGIALMSALIPGAHASLPGDLAEGQRLHDANCVRCHDSSVYARKDRTVRSLDALQRQVEGCSHLANRKFSPAEMRSLVKYLNERYYHFD